MYIVVTHDTDGYYTYNIGVLCVKNTKEEAEQAIKEAGGIPDPWFEWERPRDNGMTEVFTICTPKLA